MNDSNNEVFVEPSSELSRKAIEKRWALSCYFPVVNFVTCLLASVRMVDSEFCRFHARQGLVLFGVWVFTIFVALFSQTLSLMLWGVVLLLHGAGIFMVWKDSMVKIPILGQLAMRIPEYAIFVNLTGKQPEHTVSNTPDTTIGTAKPDTDDSPAENANKVEILEASEAKSIDSSDAGEDADSD